METKRPSEIYREQMNKEATEIMQKLESARDALIEFSDAFVCCDHLDILAKNSLTAAVINVDLTMSLFKRAFEEQDAAN